MPGSKTTSPLSVSMVLFQLQSAVNVGRIMRTCEVFQIPLSVYDPDGILEDEEKRKVISDFSCGALTRQPPGPLANPLAEVEAKFRSGRIIATCVGHKAEALPYFQFQDGDRVFIGNEYDGLPSDIIERADSKLYIPMPEVWVPKPKSFYPIDPSRDEEVAQNGLANLSASTSANIIAYSIFLQRELRAHPFRRAERPFPYGTAQKSDVAAD